MMLMSKMSKPSTSGKTTRFQVKKLYDRLAQEVLSHIEAGNEEVALKLIKSRPSEVNNCDDKGQSLLMTVGSIGSVPIVRGLLDAGAGYNMMDVDGRTALMFACRDGRTEIVKEMLEAGASMEVRDLAGWTALTWACYKGHASCVEVLLEKGDPTIDSKTVYNMTCLHWAAGRGHFDVVEILLSHSAKVDALDKYGSTPLLWAARKGYLKAVRLLLEKGANVDIVGMHSSTPLLIALHAGFPEVSKEFLDRSPNLTVTDKDGYTALALAAKQGYSDLVNDMIQKGAYINAVDKSDDSILHHAIKGGHYDIVNLLLKKNPDIDSRGNEDKTPLLLAIEKGNLNIIKLILSKNPDKELTDQDGNTALLKAVKYRLLDIARVLLDKGARLSAADKKGDTGLHVAMRTRNRKMLEILLKNPKHSKYLYLQNKLGETAYKLDSATSNGKSLLAHLFGARALNSQVAAESQLGYELYSSALADILSSPQLNTPMSVGLFAKWGSGKSFMLKKLKEDMTAYMKQFPVMYFEFSWLVFFLIFIFSLIFGMLITGVARNYIPGVAVGGASFIIIYSVLGLIFEVRRRHDYDWLDMISHSLAKRLQKFRLLLYVLFYNRPIRRLEDEKELSTIRFVFAESTKLTSLGGQQSVAFMISSLFDVLEKKYGTLVVRLYKEFGSQKDSARKFKSICCIPYLVIVLFIVSCLVTGVGLIWYYKDPAQTTLMQNVIMLTFAGIVGLSLLFSLPSLLKCCRSYIRSPQRRATTAARQSSTQHASDKFLHNLKQEVQTISSLVTTLDRHANWQSRLVLIIDGLDSCEQDKVLKVLDTINLVIPDNSPFIILLALDPHVIIRGLESSHFHGLQDASLNGNGYMRNIIHLPFYLQNHRLPELYTGEQNSNVKRWNNVVKEVRKTDRQASTFSSVMSLDMFKSGGIRTKTKDSLATEQQLAHQGHALGDEMPRYIMKTDYFIDVNPRSMRRLLNIVAVSGRLLRADNIDFDWYRLSTWINVTEQWPYRTSWILYYYEEMEGKLDGDMSLLSIYESIKDRMPTSRELEPYLGLDRNETKFITVLKSLVPRLDVDDIRRFTPATVNLDPYLRKVIKERLKDQEQVDNQPQVGSSTLVSPHSDTLFPPLSMSSHGGKYQIPPNHHNIRSLPSSYLPRPAYWYPPSSSHAASQRMTSPSPTTMRKSHKIPKGAKSLGNSSVQDICHLLTLIKGFTAANTDQYFRAINENNINGNVLLDCDLTELRPIIPMNFGDWQLFRRTILAMREADMDLSSTESINSLDEPTPSYASSVTRQVPGNPTAKKDARKSKQTATVTHKSTSDINDVEIPPAINSSGRIMSENEVFKSAPTTPITSRPNSPQTVLGMRRIDTLSETVMLENRMIMSAVHSILPSSSEEDISDSDYDITRDVPATVSAPGSPPRSAKFTLVNENSHNSDTQKLIDTGEYEMDNMNTTNGSMKRQKL